MFFASLSEALDPTCELARVVNELSHGTHDDYVLCKTVPYVCILYAILL